MTSTSPHGAFSNHDLTGRVIGAAIEVHKVLGPGFLESVYENALCIELGKRGVSFDRQVVIPIFYNDIEVGEHRLDLLVEDELIVELKACARVEIIHLATVRSYLRALGRDFGLLLNFAAAPLAVRRVSGQAPRG